MRLQILTKKDYEKSKQQVAILKKRKTFIISVIGSIQGAHAWVTLYNNFFECKEGKVFFVFCIMISIICAVYLFIKLRDTVKIAYNFSLFGFLALLYPKYPDMLFIGAGVSLFIFLLCLTVPVFTVATIQTNAIHYIEHYENPEKYNSKHKIFIKEESD